MNPLLKVGLKETMLLIERWKDTGVRKKLVRQKPTVHWHQ